MGTNFYWIARDGETCEQSDEPRCHIGKRSAAGQYCWDCGVTLCQDGTEGVHHTHSKGTAYSFVSKHTGWYDECPACGAKFEDAGWKNAAGVELGFSKSADVPRRGVSSCSSFTWTKMAQRGNYAWRTNALAATSYLSRTPARSWAPLRSRGRQTRVRRGFKRT